MHIRRTPSLRSFEPQNLREQSYPEELSVAVLSHAQIDQEKKRSWNRSQQAEHLHCLIQAWFAQQQLDGWPTSLSRPATSQWFADKIGIVAPRSAGFCHFQTNSLDASP